MFFLFCALEIEKWICRFHLSEKTNRHLEDGVRMKPYR